MRTPRQRLRVVVPRRLRRACIGILGAGQTGGSIIRTLARCRPQIDVLAWDRDAAIEPAVKRYARWAAGLDQMVRDCDVLVLAVPVHEVVRLLPVVARCVDGRTSSRRLVVCDVSTIKGPVVSAAHRCRAAFDFVGLHPLAGVEQSGWQASSSRMFVGRVVLYVPTKPDLDATARAIVRLMGGRAVPMPAQLHDRLVARTIGLPHVLAFAAAGLEEAGSASAAVTGGSWRSLTRVAVSSPAMVAGFLHGNVSQQLRVLHALQRRLAEIERELRSGSVATLERRLLTLQRLARQRVKRER